MDQGRHCFYVCLIPFVRLLLPVLAALMDLPDSVAASLPQQPFLAGSGAEPDRVHHPLHRRLDPAFPVDHAHRHAAAQSSKPSAVDALPPHAGPVRFLLRDGALLGMDLARQGLRSIGDVEGHPEALVHHGGHGGAAGDDPAGHYLYRGLGAPHGLQALAEAAPGSVFLRGPGRHPLLPAG